MSESDEGLFQHSGLFSQPFEPPVVGMHGSVKAQIMKPPRVTIHETRHAEPFREATKLTERRTPLLKVDKMRGDAPFCEKPQSLSCIRALLGTKDLDLASWGCRAWHVSLVTMVIPGQARRTRLTEVTGPPRQGPASNVAT